MSRRKNKDNTWLWIVGIGVVGGVILLSGKKDKDKEEGEEEAKGTDEQEQYWKEYGTVLDQVYQGSGIKTAPPKTKAEFIKQFSAIKPIIDKWVTTPVQPPAEQPDSKLAAQMKEEEDPSFRKVEGFDNRSWDAYNRKVLFGSVPSYNQPYQPMGAYAPTFVPVPPPFIPRMR